MFAEEAMDADEAMDEVTTEGLDAREIRRAEDLRSETRQAMSQCYPAV